MSEGLVKWPRHALEIRRAIADGEAKPGERLPPAKDLAAIEVNTNTVLRSLRLLRDEGLLSADGPPGPRLAAQNEETSPESGSGPERVSAGRCDRSLISGGWVGADPAPRQAGETGLLESGADGF